MSMINEFTLGAIMASIDSIVLPFIKYVRGWSWVWMIIPTIVYAIQPWIFSYSLNFTNLTVMNLIWDIMSDVIVTMIGLFVLKESLNVHQAMGVIFSFLAIIAFSQGRSGISTGALNPL